MTPVDLDHLRMRWAAYATDGGDAVRNAIVGQLPVLLDELAAARAEIVRLGSALLLSDAYVEREAIVAWLRDCAEYDMADRIERGDHLAAKERP